MVVSDNDTDSDDCRSGPDPGRFRVRCYNCDTRTYITDRRERFECEDCGSELRVWRGIVSDMAESQLTRRLAEGPCTWDETSSDPSHGRQRMYVQRLKGPSGSQGSSRSVGRATDVMYLPGDERRAVTRFIEENRDYVESCLESGSPSDRLNRNWPDHLYQLLVEQWEICFTDE